MQHLTLEQFRATHNAGGVLAVTLKAEGAAFEMEIETRRGPARLVKARDRDEARRFLDPRKALLLLREIGIQEAHIDSARWRPDVQERERKPRPDRAEAMKAAHEALSHTDWLRDKIARSVADPRPSIPHEQVMNEAQAVIDRKRKANAKKTTA